MGLLTLFVAVYILAALHPLFLVLVSGPTPGNSVVYEFGRNVALAAFPMVLVQPILTARISWIDRPAGMANTVRFHKAMGIAALVALLCHPVCLAFGGAGMSLLASLALPWFVIVGKVTLVTLTAHVVLALLRARIGIAYTTWKRVHALTAPAILAGAFVHSWFAGTDLSLPALQVYWIVLLVLAGTALVSRRFQRG